MYLRIYGLLAMRAPIAEIRRTTSTWSWPWQPARQPSSAAMTTSSCFIRGGVYAFSLPLTTLRLSEPLRAGQAPRLRQISGTAVLGRRVVRVHPALKCFAYPLCQPEREDPAT
jgi:hypothetical protein